LKEFGQGVGFKTSAREKQSDEYSSSVIQNALKKAFAPEFLNRIDDVIVFSSLNQEDIHKIIELELSALVQRIETNGYKIIINPEAKEFIAQKGFDPQYGARPLKRAIQKYIEDGLAEEIISGRILEGDQISIELVDGAVKITKAKVRKKKNS